MPQPRSFAAELQSDWSEWVVEHGLPPLPASATLDTTIPIARWVGAEVAAVLHVRYFDDEVDGAELDSDVDLLVRTSGQWETLGASGGTGWFDPPFVRPALPERAAHTWFQFTTRVSNRPVSALYGVAGSAATAIEVVNAAGTQTMPIESPLGAFVGASFDLETALLRVLSADGAVLLVDTFATPERPTDNLGEGLTNFVELGEPDTP